MTPPGSVTAAGAHTFPSADVQIAPLVWPPSDLTPVAPTAIQPPAPGATPLIRTSRVPGGAACVHSRSGSVTSTLSTPKPPGSRVATIIPAGPPAASSVAMVPPPSGERSSQVAPSSDHQTLVDPRAIPSPVTDGR